LINKSDHQNNVTQEEQKHQTKKSPFFLNKHVLLIILLIMIKLISNQISPNLTISDFLIGFTHLFSVKDLNFQKNFGTTNYVLFNAARTGIGQLIDFLKLSKDRKIALPAFTCSVTATPFLEAGYQIEWIDVDENGLIDFDDFNKKAKDSKIGLVLCIHIFGQTIDIDKFKTLCQRKHIFLLEDCAHFLPPPTTKGSNAFVSDARLYSFGREKIISSISGGALVWNKTSPFFPTNPKKELTPSNTPSLSETLKLLLHPLIYSLSLPWWNIGGKILPIIAHKLNILPPIITHQEKKGHEDFPRTKLAQPLQHILKQQFKKYHKIESHRQSIAQYWKSILTQKGLTKKEIMIPKNAFRVILKKSKTIIPSKTLHLREWDGNPIAPSGIDLTAFEYPEGLCPSAEFFAENYQTLPTNIRTTIPDLKKLEKKIQLKEH